MNPEHHNVVDYINMVDALDKALKLERAWLKISQQAQYFDLTPRHVQEEDTPPDSLRWMTAIPRLNSIAPGGLEVEEESVAHVTEETLGEKEELYSCCEQSGDDNVGSERASENVQEDMPTSPRPSTPTLVELDGWTHL